jgi:HAD superfamily hydrolase (TIGR01509 family)
MKTVLATSSDEEDLAIYGKLVGMDGLVDEASSSADAKASKPEADSIAAALEKVKIRAEQAVALGDTPWDAQAAGKLGIPVMGLTSGGWKADDLRSAGCVEV